MEIGPDTGGREAFFREVNDSIERTAARLGPGGDAWDFLCECGRADCTEMVRLTLKQYHEVRGYPGQHPVVAEHVAAESEVVAHRDGHVIVEGRPADA